VGLVDNMLIITFHNDGTGENGKGNYDYTVYVNKNKIAEGRLENHYRGDWRRLMIDLGDDLDKELIKEEWDYQQQKRPESIPF
jgi:hypothetical protein